MFSDLLAPIIQWAIRSFTFTGKVSQYLLYWKFVLLFFDDAQWYYSIFLFSIYITSKRYCHCCLLNHFDGINLFFPFVVLLQSMIRFHFVITQSSQQFWNPIHHILGVNNISLLITELAKIYLWLFYIAFKIS